MTIVLTKQNDGQTITIQAEPNCRLQISRRMGSVDGGTRPIVTGIYQHHVQRGVFGLQVEGRDMPNILKRDEWSLID